MMQDLCYLWIGFTAALRQWLWRCPKPVSNSPLSATLTDLTRSRAELIAENTLLRQQVAVLRRAVKRPPLTRMDRLLLVFLASRTRFWQSALLIVQPDTLLRWHRQLFCSFWRRKSKTDSRKPKLPDEIAALIRQMARENRLWGAERIRGELLKLGMRVSKRSIQKYLRQACPPRPRNQHWRTFLRNHAGDIWTCDFLQTYDLFFRTIVVFFIIELGSRRVVQVAVTRHPTQAWVAQQLREATPFDHAPRFLIRDNDSKFGTQFDRVAASRGIEVLRTPYQAPKANAVCERFLGSVRRECLDHLLILSEKHLARVVGEYVRYFNRARPHHGNRQRLPEPDEPADTSVAAGEVISRPVLAGLHHDYRRAA